ncbi:MAG: alpha/beta hydrolase [Henriciella sp.]|nr:alpha/beta hydrolase [Henriciella sp.]
MTNSRPTEHTFTSQRLKLSYALWDKPGAETIVLVHGGRDQKHSWDWVATHLARKYRVVAFDLRGHGKSQWSNDGDYGVMDHVFDLATLMDDVVRSDAILIGHSLGGNIVLRYCGLFPDRVTKLVAIEGLGPSPKMLAQRNSQPIDERLRDWIEQRRKLSTRLPRVMQDPEQASARMRAAFTQLSETHIQHLTKTGITTNQDGTVSWAYDPAGMGRSPSDIPYQDFQFLWTQVTCPTWLVYGARSWASDPQKDGRASHFSNASVSIIENAGHWLHHDQFDNFITALDAFLNARQIEHD